MNFLFYFLTAGGFFAAGAAMIYFNFRGLQKCKTVPRLPGEIIACRHAGHNSGGICVFTYAVQFDENTVITMERDMLPLGNHLLLTPLRRYLGKIENVPYDSKTNSLIKQETIWIRNISFGILLCAVGILLAILFAQLT